MAETNLTRFRVTYQNEPVEQALSLGDGDTIFNDIQLADTSQCLALNVTSEQYKLLLSAAINGANRHFPENWIEIIYPLIAAGKEYCGGSMSCEDIADCIENDVAVQQAIADANNQLGIVNPDSIGDVTNNYINQRFPQELREQPFAPDPTPQCDLDKLWTGILEVVTRLDEASRDAWEDLSALADKADRIGEAIAIIPLLGDIPGEVIAFLAEVIPDLLTAYNAHSSQEVLEDIACDLFNMVCSECRYPTAQELYTYYASFGITGIQDLLSYGLDAAVDYLIGSSTLANSVVFFTTNAIQLYFRYLGGTWLGKRGLKWLAIWADIGEDNPNNGWELLCDPCGTGMSYIEYDLTEAQGDFVIDVGNWQAGLGAVGIDIDANPSNAIMQVKVSNPSFTGSGALIAGIGMEMVTQDTQIEGSDNMTLQLSPNGTSWSGASLNAFGTTGLATMRYSAFVGSFEYDFFRFWRTVRDEAADNPSVRLTRIRIWFDNGSPVKGTLTNIPHPGNFNTNSEVYWQ